jgi:hypothetical protein
MKRLSSKGASAAEEVRRATVTLLKREKRRTGEAKLDWLDYERTIADLADFSINRGFLLGLLLVKKFGKVKVTVELSQ